MKKAVRRKPDGPVTCRLLLLAPVAGGVASIDWVVGDAGGIVDVQVNTTVRRHVAVLRPVGGVNRVATNGAISGNVFQAIVSIRPVNNTARLDEESVIYDIHAAANVTVIATYLSASHAERATSDMHAAAAVADDCAPGSGIVADDPAGHGKQAAVDHIHAAATNTKYGGGVYVYSKKDSISTFIMSGGEISGNTAKYGGGVYVYSYGIFKKTGNSIIYGSDGNDYANKATDNNSGDAVYVNMGSGSSKKRNSTAGSGTNLDSSTGDNWE
jgi:hypothetical protein